MCVVKNIDLDNAFSLRTCRLGQLFNYEGRLGLNDIDNGCPNVIADKFAYSLYNLTEISL